MEPTPRKNSRTSLAIVAVTIVVVFAVVILLIGSPFTSKPSTTTVKTSPGHEVTVLSDNLTVGFGSGLWGLTIENSGSVPIKQMTAVLSTPTETEMCTGYNNLLVFVNCPESELATPYAPGTTVRSYASGAGPGSAVPGSSYPVTLRVTFVDGTATNFTSTVTAANSG